MLTREQRREILGMALLALALFVLLSLVPVWLLGPRGMEWFPSGNMMGLAGGTVQGVLVAFLGVSALLAPMLLAVGGLRAGGWQSPRGSLRSVLLLAGLGVLLPTGLWIVLADPQVSGWLGEAVGVPLLDLVSPLGAVLITGVALIALSVGTVGWNPIRSLVRGVRAGGEATSRAARALAGRGRRPAGARASAGRGSAGRGPEGADVPVAEPLPGLAPEWLTEAEAAMMGSTDGDRAATDGVRAATDGVRGARADAAEAAGAGPEVRPSGPGDLLDPQADSEVEHQMPPVDLLSAPDRPDRTDMERDLDELGRILVEKLRTFNVESEVCGRTTGPMVTQFEVVPAPGVKVNRIANLDADLALAMRAQTIRIVAPIPGKGAVGVEIPNPRPEIVNLREILESPAFRHAKGELPLALGKDLTGRPYIASLEKMPHVLIAGATGAGKSVCLNTIITSLVYKHTPETLRLLMIDPKMVELSVYARLPHLRHNVVTDPRDAAGVLKWAVLEMERRYGLLKANHVRSMQEFNRKVRDGLTLKRSEPKGPEGSEDRWIHTDGVMPYIVVVVDELADLMMTVQSEVEKPLTQLAQKARAIGVHLIVATQRPSVNVITGLIKANFPTRIAFRVASKTDSRTILDQNGADALLGNGDMLFLPPDGRDPVRIQGAYLPTEDTERLMGWYIELLERRESTPPAVETAEPPESDILEELRGRELEEAAAVEEIAGDWDELFRAAAEVCIQNGGGSTSLLQRRLSIGYGRAARIVDQLFDAGVLGPSDGSKGRDILVDLDDLDAICAGRGG